MPHHSFEISVANRRGIHALPSALLVKLLSFYPDEVTLTMQDEEVNAKSIMAIMMVCGVDPPFKVTFEVKGENGATIERELRKMIEFDFVIEDAAAQMPYFSSNDGDPLIPPPEQILRTMRSISSTLHILSNHCDSEQDRDYVVQQLLARLPNHLGVTREEWEKQLRIAIL